VVGDAGAPTDSADSIAESAMDVAHTHPNGPGDGTGKGGEAPVGAAWSTNSMPRARGEILPQYPRAARRAGFEGVVTISVFIDETGRVVSAGVLASSGHQSLDQAALDAVRHALFDPAEWEARPIPSRVIIPIRFRLVETGQ
jgi:protein TonB